MVTKEHLEKAKEITTNLIKRNYCNNFDKDIEYVAQALEEAEEKGRQEKVKELIFPFIKGTFNNKLQEMKK